MICPPHDHRESPDNAPVAAGRAASAAPSRWHRVAASVALPAVLLASLAGCGGSSEQLRLGAETIADEPRPQRYAAALRLAAVARVEARAGLDELAAEHFRAAYRKHEDAAFLLAGAVAAERARLYAEASDMLREALTHELPKEQRNKAESDLARVAPQVPAGLVRVPIHVAPEGARVELTRSEPGQVRPAGSKPDRVVLVSGWVFLQPGTWSIYSTARGYQPELQTVKVVRSGSSNVQVALRPEDRGPSVADPTRPSRDDRSVAVPGPTAPDEEPGTDLSDASDTPEPAPKPEPKPRPKPEPIAKPEPKPETEPIAKPEPKPEPKPVVVKKPKPKPIDPDPTEPGLDPGEGPTVELDVAHGPQGVHKWGPYATAGLGVALLGAGGFFGYTAQQSGQQASDLGSQNLSPAAYDSQFGKLVQQAEDQALFANLAFAGGGLLLAAGTAWWWFAPVATPQRPKSPSSGAGTTGAGALVPKGTSLVPQVLASPQSLGFRWDF